MFNYYSFYSINQRVWDFCFSKIEVSKERLRNPPTGQSCHCDEHMRTIQAASCSAAKLYPTPATSWTAACQSMSFTVSRNLLRLMSIEPMMPSNHLTYCCSLLLLSSILIFPSYQALLSASGGQSIGASTSVLVLPVNMKCWFPLGFSSKLSNPRSDYLAKSPFPESVVVRKSLTNTVKIVTCW